MTNEIRRMIRGAIGGAFLGGFSGSDPTISVAQFADLVAKGEVPRDSDVLVFNTGSGASYRV